MDVTKEIHCVSKESFLLILQKLFDRGHTMGKRKEIDEDYMWRPNHNYMHIWSDGSITRGTTTYNVHNADIQRFVDVDFLAVLDSDSAANDLIEIL